MSNVLHVMQVDSSAEDWQEFIRLKFIERFSNPDLKADTICDHQDNTPEGTVGVSTAAQVGVASEVPDTKAHIHTPDMSRFQRKS